MYKVFIDGQAGTTGLQIHQRLSDRADIKLLEIDAAARKDNDAKLQVMEDADVVILCLPDDAAKETVALAESRLGANNPTRFIDASTAHRTNPEWVYGLPELDPGQRELIAEATHVSNPGCYPTGFLLAISPLIKAGLLKPSSLLSINALSGYSGGGKKMMQQYEQRTLDAPNDLWHARPYALSLTHKHVPEMQYYAALERPPIFMPSVGHFAQGMLVNIGLFAEFFTTRVTPEMIFELLNHFYIDEPCINVIGANDTASLHDGLIEPQANNGSNLLDLFVFGHEEQILLVARLDNLGKGASGAAVQNLNIMFGIPELTGLS